MSTQVEVNGEVVAVRTSRRGMGFIVEMQVTEAEWEAIRAQPADMGSDFVGSAQAVVQAMCDGEWDSCGPANQVWKSAAQFNAEAREVESHRCGDMFHDFVEQQRARARQVVRASMRVVR